MSCACPWRHFSSLIPRRAGRLAPAARRTSRLWPLPGPNTRKIPRVQVALRVMARIDAFLKLTVAQNCSDLHLAVGVPPMMRMHGDLLPIKFRDLGEAE